MKKQGLNFSQSAFVEMNKKLSTEVEAGDVIHIEFGTGSVTVRVLATPETVRKEEAETLYEVIE